jgi:predicted dehydrogenase
MITRLGVIGCGYGAQVLVPAFRADERVEVVAIAARSAGRAEAAAGKLGIPQFMDDWRAMLDPGRVDAVAIAAPPDAQAGIATAAFAAGLHVFAEKPLALTLADAQGMASKAAASGRAHAIDFNFREITALRMARELLHDGTLGAIRHVAVAWQVESYANKARLESWKTDQGAGGGALSNFVSHALDYLEWFMGPIIGLSARLAGMPGDARDNDTFVSLTFAFASGAAGSLVMSAAAYRGSGHKIEFYGEDGTLVLDNPGPDHMRGFNIRIARRPDDFVAVEIPPAAEDIWEDGRVLPSSRLASRFIGQIHGGAAAEPDFSAGLRVQKLLDGARHSHTTGHWAGA